MEAVDMNRRLHFCAFVFFTVFSSLVWSFNENANVMNFQMHSISAEEAIDQVSIDVLHRRKRDVGDVKEDPKCRAQEDSFLKDLRNGKNIVEKYVFENKTHFNLAMAWASDKNEGTLIVVTTEIVLGMFATSNIWRSTDYGRNWDNIDNKVNTTVRKDNGLQRNPHDASIVYMLTYHEYMFVTEDGGESFTKRKVVDERYTISSQLIFHADKRSQYIMAISDNKKLYASKNNFVDKRMIHNNVHLAKWGTPEAKDPEAIYALMGNSLSVIDIFRGQRVIAYTLIRYDNMESDNFQVIRSNVVSFGLQRNFLYATVYDEDKPTQNSKKLVVVSTDRGKTWNEAQLPTVTPDRFFSVLDMSEGLIFMHVDNPGDTGHGTLYTSGINGVIYSESLQRHLYPNYNSITDFFKVESMRGVFIASQINADSSIHTVISFNRGATWQAIPLPRDTCKDHTKACELQIHNYYSISRGLRSRPPLSSVNAPGLILVHGHGADALQTTDPDVFITTDGGYTWRKTLDGSHYYQIADSGGLLLAVSTKKGDPHADTIKFSTDEGNCWHDYKFSDKKIMFTGVLTEPGSKSMIVSIWGYSDDDKKQWMVHVIDFEEVITKRCDNNDYIEWRPHAEMRRVENKGVDGCLLGVRETFKKLKPESWCRNGYTHQTEKTVEVCTCTREDYECDYGFYRPPSTDDCTEDPRFTGKEIDVCLRGHEEEIITQGFRKIPGDGCKDGIQFTGHKINLTVQCAPGNKELITELIRPQAQPDHSILIGLIVTVVVIFVIAFLGYFGYKMYLLRKHKVVYRYSMLNQNEGESIDTRVEDILTPTSLYQDSDDEAIPPTKVMNGSARKNIDSNGRVAHYHDDSDDDMLE